MLWRFLVFCNIYGSTVGAVNAESPKRTSSNISKKYFGQKTIVFLMDLNHILYERSCNYFQWFPHTPMPPRPLKRPKNNDFFLDIFPNIIFLLFLRALGAIVPWCHRGAIIFVCIHLAIYFWSGPEYTEGITGTIFLTLYIYIYIYIYMYIQLVSKLS